MVLVLDLTDFMDMVISVKTVSNFLGCNELTLMAANMVDSLETLLS